VALVSRRVKQIKAFTPFFRAIYKTDEAVKILIGAIKSRGTLRSNMEKVNRIKATQQAHHVIPIESLMQCPLVQKAVLEGFLINGARNGLALSILQHKRGHADLGLYNRYVIGELLRAESMLPKNYTGKQAKQIVEKLVDDIRKDYFGK
jgi:hypothetical protein